jgi:hypothetical protein
MTIPSPIAKGWCWLTLISCELAMYPMILCCRFASLYLLKHAVLWRASATAAMICEFQLDDVITVDRQARLGMDATTALCTRFGTRASPCRPRKVRLPSGFPAVIKLT